MKRRQIVGCFLMGTVLLLSFGAWWLWPRPRPLPPVRQGLLYSTGIGLIDRTGQPVSETFDEVGEVVGDTAPYREGRYWGLLPTLQPQFEELRAPREFLMAVRWEGRWGFADVNGVEKIAPRYQAVGDFCDGRAAFEVNGRWGFLAPTGAVLVQPVYAEAGLYPRVRDGSNWVFLGQEGRYQDARDFHEGLAAVKLAGQWGYLDRQGQLHFPQFEDARDFSAGMGAVRKGGQWGYIDSQGHFVIPPQYAEAEEFSEGMAAVRSGNQWHYVDVAGRKLWDLPQGMSQPGPFHGGLARATWQGKASYLDRTGRQIWPAKR